MPRPASSQNDQDEDLNNGWEWIHRPVPDQQGRSRRDSTRHIIGARNGDLECHVGDCVLLKADGANQVWAAIITKFIEFDEDGEMAADFLWFSPENEIRNGPRKRSDFLSVRIFHALFLRAG